MKRYNSKTGIGVLLFVVITIGGVAFLCIYYKEWIGLALCLLTILFFGYILISIYYVIKGDVLKIKCGFMVNKTIDISSIRKISETNNPLSSPANSLDRLEINYGNAGTILRSPNDKAGFIKCLLVINPKIELYLKNEDLLK